ncbi:MAG: RluA family pseudouridine synthase [Roseiflexaceae bacterium]|nr:RluA family pseudouridine synthase [Roseiflexaceae bacterium]
MTTGPEWMQVAADADGKPLGVWLAEALGSEAAVLIARGGVWVDRYRAMDAALHLAAGSTVVVHRSPSGAYPDVVIDPERIVYEDADLLAIDKPVGAYVEMTPWDAARHVRGALVQMLTNRDGVVPQLHLAHRLDRDTSGVLLLTKNPRVNAALYASFGGRMVHKTYLALCAGDPDFDEIEITTGHGRSRHGFFRVYPIDEVGRELPDGAKIKIMQTRVLVVRRSGHAALIQAFPLTGRTHQIRLHMAHLGHPLIGDAKYGGPTNWRGMELAGHLLHAARLEVAHPRTQLPLVIEAPHPDWTLEP